MVDRATNSIAQPVYFVDTAGAGDMPMSVRAAQRTPKGFQQITSLAASTSLTVPSGSTYAVIQAEAQALRWRDDGVAPTATVGMTIPAGGELRYDGSLAALRLIEVAASAKANITYYS